MRKEVQQAIEFLCKEFEEFDDVKGEFNYNENEQVVTVPLPYDEDLTNYPASQFLEEVEECKGLNIQEVEGTVSTEHRFYQLVSPDDETSRVVEMYGKEIGTRFMDGIKVTIKHSNLIVGCAALKTQSYHRKYYSPFLYTAVEVYRPNSQEKLDRLQATHIVDSFLFELADSHKTVYAKDRFVSFADFNDPDIEFIESKDWSFRPLESYNEGIRLHLAALQVTDPELRLLSLYKVLEFFTPVVFNMEANEALRKKLDSPKALSPNNEFLRSIFELTKNFDIRRSDKEMMKSLFTISLDIVELSPLLPTSLRQEVTYGSKDADINNYSRKIAEVVVATRNKVAHAKSNYIPSGNECSATDIPQFNVFLEAAAAQTIRWYNRLPEHHKLGM
jgi:hypothetical protein